MPQYVALLRGINVGGSGLIRMPDLKASFEAQGFGDVQTYIQSGNVLFDSDEGSAVLGGRIEAALSKTFGLEARVVVLSLAELRRVVHGAPDGFGARPALYRYDVIFLRRPLSAEEALRQAPVRPDVDQVLAGPGVLYFSRLARKAAQSRMSRLAGLPIYKQLTIRNWNTTTRLLELMEARGSAPRPRAPVTAGRPAPRGPSTDRSAAARPSGGRPRSAGHGR